MYITRRTNTGVVVVEIYWKVCWRKCRPMSKVETGCFKWINLNLLPIDGAV